MNMNNYKMFFSQTILQRGKIYFKEKRYEINGEPQNNLYSFIVHGSNDYNVSVTVMPDGSITTLSCNCPYDGNCKHEAAVLEYMNSIFERKISNCSSTVVKNIIIGYAQDAKDETSESALPPVRLVPELNIEESTLRYTLKIGRSRFYSTGSLRDFFRKFTYNDTKKYGKELTFTHRESALDKQSRKLLHLSANIFNESLYYGYGTSLGITGRFVEEFFRIYENGTVSVNGEEYAVKFQDPVLELKIRKTNTGRFEINDVRSWNKYFYEDSLCVVSDTADDKAFYICSDELSHAAGRFFDGFKQSKLYVSQEDMKQFYPTVLKPLSRFVRIEGAEVLEEYIPPELNVELYLDYADGCARGRLVFMYGDVSRNPFTESDRSLVYDFAGEAVAVAAVKKYFNVTADESFNLTTQGDDMLYSLIYEGIDFLSGTMEIFTTDRFDRVCIQKPVRPVVGVRPSGNLLELEITADGYTIDQLIDLLHAYRQGKKYHRLKDGGFAELDDESFGEFSRFTESLDLSDRALRKEKLKIPAFRMLYLDNLAESRAGVKINRSAEFKKKVKEYKELLSYSESITVPESLEGVLREYQVVGYRWLCTVAAYGFGGILADDMGLGKTIQAAAFMLNGKLSSKEHIINLVICPSSVILNWESELIKFAPQLKALPVMGTAAERDRQLSQMDECDVVITSYSLMARDFDKYSDMEFYSIFLDEAQYIKNHTTQAAKSVKSLNGVHRFALTGTPVENSLAELWSIFDFIMPNYLFGYSHFKSSFETPIVKNGSEDATASLQKMVSPFILRRMKKDVLTELPDKTETILYTDMAEEQSKIYSANVASVIAAADKSDDSATDKIKILAMLTRLRQICCDPSLVYENYSGGSAKLEQCLELIESCVRSGHKILLFSQFTSMLEIIENRLSDMDISYYKLTGATKTKDRLPMTKKFNSDDTKVFLISLKAGGTGLNLTGADIVIHYDPWWNSSAENQASDRAYRIGQKNNVQIYKMITRKTVEEKIRELQQSKSELADIAMSGENASEGSLMKMSVKEILQLLQ